MSLNQFLTAILSFSLVFLPITKCQVSVQGKFRNLIDKNNWDFEVYQLPSLSNDRLKRNYYLKRHGVHTFGKSIPVSIDMNDFGDWKIIQTSDEEFVNIWSLKLESETSYSLNLLFDKFWLSTSAELYLVDEDQNIFGAYTAGKNNKKSLTFATSPIKGGQISILLFENGDGKSIKSFSKIHIHSVVHGFLPQASAGPCNIDVVCEKSNSWKNQTRAVALMLTDSNTGYCSGSMINSIDPKGKRQYFLTAYHCVSDIDDGEIGYHILGFNYENKLCNTDKGDKKTFPEETVQGLKIVSKNRLSDYALLEVVEEIPREYNTYLAGWSRSSNSIIGFAYTGIHHPSAGIKKISFSSILGLGKSCWSECPQNYHWKIPFWRNGTTEPGSSGSPLFNPNGLIVGQLHGGSASCYYPMGYDQYGGLYASWSLGLNSFLDPLATNVMELDGIFLNE